MTVLDHSQKQTAIRTDLAAIFVSMELSRAEWLITSLSPRRLLAMVEEREG